MAKKWTATPGCDDERDPAQRHRDRMAQNSRDAFKKAADIGELEAVVDPKRKAACKKSLLKFLTVYFPGTTGLSPFSDDHKRVGINQRGQDSLLVSWSRFPGKRTCGRPRFLRVDSKPSRLATCSIHSCAPWGLPF